MTLDEAIKHCEEVTEKNEIKASWFWGKEGNPNYENCIECAKEYRQLATWLKELKQLREQMSHSEKPNKWINKPQESENEKIIRISKGTLKARTGKYVIYDVEWLKEHFNTTEAKIYGQTNKDCISRKEVLDSLHSCFAEDFNEDRWWNSTHVLDIINKAPSVEALQEHQHYKDLAESYEKTINKLTKAIAEPQQKTGHWIKHKHNGKPYFKCSECLYFAPIEYSYCPECGAKMQEEKK